jgi:DNA-binding response OmpR family regulator
MEKAIRALIVDDEETIRQYLRETLRRIGYLVTTAVSGEEALQLIRDKAFDVAIVDLNLGGKTDGQNVLEALRWRWPATAVVILTAYGSLESAIAAIAKGVDSYLLKPVKPPEIRAAVQQALDRRRQLRGSTEAGAISQLACGAFRINLEAHTALREDGPLNLAPQEFKLLTCLVQNAPKVVSPIELVNTIKGTDIADHREASKIIKWYIHRLRQRVEPDPAHPCHILTVRGIGYRFQA